MDWNNQHQPLPHETLRNSHAYQQYQRQRQMTLGDLLLEIASSSCKARFTPAMPMRW